MPSTCVPSCQDALFHVLYGGNMAFVAGLIEEAVISLAREYPTQGVNGALQLLRPVEGDSLNHLRVKFFVLLNEDEASRVRLGTQPPRPSTMRALCPHKARRFYDELCDELLPAFVQNYTMQLADMVDQLREAYLHS